MVKKGAMKNDKLAEAVNMFDIDDDPCALDEVYSDSDCDEVQNEVKEIGSSESVMIPELENLVRKRSQKDAIASLRNTLQV